MNLTNEDIKTLGNLFYDNSFLSRNLEDFILRVRDHDLKYTRTQISDFYNLQEIVQLFKPYHFPKNENKTIAEIDESAPKKGYQPVITTDEPFKRFYLDTMYFSKFQIAIVCGMDLFSKYGFLKPFPWKKNKIDESFKGISAQNGRLALQTFLKEIEGKLKYTVQRVITDQGSEFKNEFTQFCEDNGIQHVMINQNKNMLYPIERFNGTIRRLVEKFVYIHGDIKMKDIGIIADTYNNNVHRTIGFPPKRVFENENILDLVYYKYHGEPDLDTVVHEYKNKYDIGDHVRVLLHNIRAPAYTRKVGQNWSKTIYTIKFFDNKNGKYTLSNDKQYEEYQLQYIDGVIVYIPDKKKIEVKEYVQPVSARTRGAIVNKELKKLETDLVDIKPKHEKRRS